MFLVGKYPWATTQIIACAMTDKDGTSITLLKLLKVVRSAENANIAEKPNWKVNSGSRKVRFAVKKEKISFFVKLYS